jgi:hypothetical protein
MSEVMHGSRSDQDRRGERPVEETAGSGNGRDIDEHARRDMDPIEGLPIALEHPAIVGATCAVVEDRLDELCPGLDFEIVQVEQARQPAAVKKNSRT